MTKISTYDNDESVDFLDRLFGTNQSGKNKNYGIKEIVALINSVAGKDYIQYEFSLTNYSNIGAFTTNASENNPSGVTKLFLNKQSATKKDLTVLFTKLDTLQNIVIELRNPSDANNFATFKTTNITSHTSYFEFDVVLYKSFSSGLLTAGATYSAYFDVKENFEDKLGQGNYVGTAETLKTDIETRVVKVTGKSLVLDTEITKLSHLDDTTDLQKPVSVPQQEYIDNAIESQITDSTLIADATIPIVELGNVHTLGTGPGTYANWGGMVIPANHTGTLRRVDGVFSVSTVEVIGLDLKADKTELINKANLEVGKNLFNWQDPDVIIGSVIAYDGLFYVQNSNYIITGFIPVTAGDNIISNRASSGYNNNFYDSNKSYISTDPGNSYLTVPAGASYLRKTVVLGGLSLEAAKIQIEKGRISSGYEAYGFKFDNIKFDKVPLILNSKNLFISETATPNSYVDYGNGNINSPHAVGMASDFIPVIAGSVYSCNSNQGYKAFYNSDKVFVSGSDSNFPATIPNGCSYIRITVGTEQQYTAQFELGSIQTSYVKGGYNSKYPYYKERFIQKLVTIGDSITEGNNWQPKLASEFNLEHINLGISGTTISGGTDGGAVGDGMWTTQRIAQIPTDTGVIILNGGMNDYFRDIAIGVISSTNTSEFYGALNKWVERAMIQAPNAKIFIATTTYGENGEFSSDPNYANASGNTTKEYATAMRNISIKYGLPCIDFSGNCIVNKWNIAVMASDKIHPNSKYADIMTTVASSVISNYI